MKTLVVYYSLEGNTRHMAETIAAALGADLQELRPVRDIPAHGLRKFFWGGKQMLTGEEPELQPLERRPADYDRVVLGTPVWAGSFAPALRSFFKACAFAGKQAAVFCCHGGGKGRVFTRLREQLAGNTVCGQIDFVEPLARGVEDADRRAREWAAGLWPAG